MYKNTFIFNNFKTTAFFTVEIFKWNNKTKNSIYIYMYIYDSCICITVFNTSIAIVCLI